MASKKTSKVDPKSTSTIGLGEQVSVEMATMSIRFPRSLHDRLRKLGFDKRTPMLDFIVRGIEQVLKEQKY